MTDMHDLLALLDGRSAGLGTFAAFQQAAQSQAARSPDHAALLQLLADVAGRFIAAYDGEPLPTTVAAAALARLRALAADSAGQEQAPDRRLAHLNRIAQTDLSRAS